MASKRPLYTAIGFTVWKISGIVIRRRLRALRPGKKTLLLGVVGVAAAGVAAGTLGSGSGSNEQ